MTQITAYAYNSDYQCVGCTVEYTQAMRDTAYCALDANAVPVEAKDSDGNPVHPVFSTDELPTVLGDTFGDTMRWHEAVEYYTCGSCRQQFSFLTGEQK